jgi:holliday junction DNA helicase RuvA
MISYLRGKIIYKSNNLKKDNFLTVDVGGVGYKVFISNKSWAEFLLGHEVELHVYTQVAETALDLYGFKSREELEFFELLLTISGIGPRSASDIMGKAKVADLSQAVQSGNHEILSKVSGIGAKTAEKIVVGLKGKLGGGFESSENWSDDFGDALEALIGLGYSAFDAKNALAKVKSTDVGEKIKEALKLLGRK